MDRLTFNKVSILEPAWGFQSWNIIERFLCSSVLLYSEMSFYKFCIL